MNPVSRITPLRAALCAMLSLIALVAQDSAATELVYRPTNPSFGGDPANGSVLMNSANAQNKHNDPSMGSSSGGGMGAQTPLQQFADTLQRSILSRISSSVSGGLFNASGGLMPGTVDTSDFRITITDVGGGALQITTTDKSSGQMSSFQVSQ